MSSLYEVAKVCDASAKGNFAVLTGTHDRVIQVPTFDWANHLKVYFRRLPGIKSFQHFRMTKENPGKVSCYVTLDSEPTVLNLLGPRIQGIHEVTGDLPPVIQPFGLSLDRQRYLFDEIREFCMEGTEDLVAPEP